MDDPVVVAAQEHEVVEAGRTSVAPVLDVVGDLSLVGRPLQADIVARRSGHALNQELARLLAAG